jgi:CHAT domain
MPYILALQASPHSYAPLRLMKEIREINTRFLIADNKSYRIAPEGAVQVNDLAALLMKHKPEIVHFGGHGTEYSELVLEDVSGNAAPVPLPALRDMFSILREKIRCVVLNACYSSEQAEAIAESVDCVIGMSHTVSDTTAINFAAGFYQALAFGKSVQQAFELGKNEVALNGLKEDQIPQLHIRKGVDANAIFFCDPSPKMYAEFDLNKKGKPLMVGEEGEEYAMRLYVRHTPPGALSVVYQFSDDTISRRNEFFEIKANGRDFETEVSFYGDIRIRATVWYENHGIGILTWLSDALAATYENSPSEYIATAIRSIKEE